MRLPAAKSLSSVVVELASSGRVESIGVTQQEKSDFMGRHETFVEEGIMSSKRRYEGRYLLKAAY